MKKIFFLFFAVAALFFGCRNEVSDSSNELKMTLMQRIAIAENGDEIDLEKEDLLIRKNTPYVISKSITIKNGDVKNAKFIVKSPGVVLKNIERVKTVIVDENVGDGNFTFENCKPVEELFLNGGGEAIYIDSTAVLKLVVKKVGVHIVFRGSAPVTRAFVFSGCKLDSESSGASIENVIVSETVKNLALAGVIKIGRIISENGATVTIIVDVNVAIGPADSTIQDAIKNNPENSDYNNKGEGIKDAELTEDDKNDITQVKEELKKIEMTAGDFYLWEQNLITEETRTTRPNAFDCEYVKSIENIFIEKTDSEYIFENKEPHLFRVWKYFIQPTASPEVKAGKNYKISFDLKSDKDGYVKLEAKDGKVSCIGNSVYCKVSTEYQTFSVTTGTAKYDWADSTVFIACGTVSKLYIKNYTIEEILDVQYFGTAVNIGSEDNSPEDIVAVFTEDTVDISFKKGCPQNTGVDIRLLNNPIPVGKISRLTFDITSDADLAGGYEKDNEWHEGEFSSWAHSFNNQKDTTGFSKHPLSKGVTEKVTMYLAGIQFNGEKVRIPTIWFSCGKPCNLKIENIEIEETSIPEILNKNPDLGLYFAGTLEGDWHFIPCEKSIAIPAGKFIYGQFVLSDKDEWHSKKNTVTSFRVMSENVVPGIKVEKRLYERYGTDDTYFVNTTDETVFVKFSLDDKFKMCVTQGSVDDCEGMFGNLAYLGISTKENPENWTGYNLDYKYDFEPGKWYKTTYDVEYVKKRNESIESYGAFLKRATWLKDSSLSVEGIYTDLTENIFLEANTSKNIKQIFYFPEQPSHDTYFSCFGVVFGYNAIVKFSGWNTEELPDAGSWFYYDINKADLPEEFFNIIFNNGFGAQSAEIRTLSAAQPVYWYDFFEPKLDASSHYNCVQSSRSDNPVDIPSGDFVRIYFYSKLGDSEPPYLHYWCGTDSETTDFSTVWPGKMMIKY